MTREAPKLILIEVEESTTIDLETLSSIFAQFTAPGPVQAKSVSSAYDDGFGRIVAKDTISS